VLFVNGLPVLNDVIEPVLNVSEILHTATKQLHKNPDMASSLLGYDSEDGKNYLFLFQNPAQIRPLGGVPSHMMLVNIKRSKIEFAGSGNSMTFPFTFDMDYRALERPDSFYNIWPLHIFRSILSITGYPNFPVDAQVAKIDWEKQYGDHIDAVVAFDPVGLSYLLRATGPLTIEETGDTLTSENAVSLLLNEYYVRYSKKENWYYKKDEKTGKKFYCWTECASDAAFDAVKEHILEAIQGKLDYLSFLGAIGQSIDEKRLLVWFNDADEQKIVEGNGAQTKVRGVIPDDTATKVNIAAYFWDVEASKVDYYMDTSDEVTREYCLAEKSTYYLVDNTITSQISATEASKLPGFIHSGNIVRTDLFAIGPQNSEFVGWTPIERGSSSDLFKKGNDPDLGGRFVARSRAYMQFTTNKHRFIFKSPGIDMRELNILSNPAINPVKITEKAPIFGCEAPANAGNNNDSKKGADNE
jgi:hypothetical protein